MIRNDLGTSLNHCGCHFATLFGWLDRLVQAVVKYIVPREGDLNVMPFDLKPSCSSRFARRPALA
jgi:hypothetical protein